MISGVLKHILRIGFLILLQGLVVNRLNLMDGMILPSVYVFGILMLPLATNRVALMVIGFIVGALVDSFTNTLGLHTSATVLMAFMQPVVLRVLSPREGYEPGLSPTIQDMGLTWYLAFAGMLTLIHHLWLFFIELLRFTPFWMTLGKVLLSTLASILLMVIGQYLIYSSVERNRS